MATDFPAFLTIEHKPSASAKSSFLAEIARLTGDAETLFRRSFSEIDRIVSTTTAAFSKGALRIDIDTSSLRRTQTDAQLTVEKLRALEVTSKSLAKSTGDTTRETRQFIAAMQAQRIEAERNKATIDAQVATYSRLQAEMDRFQRRGPVDTRTPINRLLDGDASIDRAALSATTLEQVLGRVATKSRDVAAAMQQFNAGEQALRQQAIEAQATAQSLQFLAAVEREEAAAKDAAAQAANRAEAQNIQFTEALARARAESERAAAASERFASDLELVRRAIDPTRVAQQQLDTELARADRAFEAGAISAREYGIAVNSAADRYSMLVTGARQGTTAQQNVINSTRASRVAFVQLGQQMQDVVVQAQMGTNAFTIFAQQVPQAAFALSGLEGSANKTQAAVGKVATVLSGPLGAALFGSIALLGPFALQMFRSGEEADKAEKRHRTLTEVLRDEKAAHEEVTEALEEYIRAQERSREVTILSIQDKAAEIKQSLEKAIALREELAATLEYYEAQARLAPRSEAGERVAQSAFRNADTLRAAVAANQADLDGLQQAAGEVVRETASAIAELQTDREKNIREGFEILRKEAQESIKPLDELTSRLAELNRQEQAALEALRKTSRTRTDAIRGERTMAEFASPLAAGSYRTSSAYGVQRGDRKHYGIDYAAPAGTPVYATQAGTIAFAGAAGTYGNLIKIGHGAGTETRYGHLSQIGVQNGQVVNQGDLIGRVGSTGRSTGPHLHYEVRVNGKAVDPTKGQFPIDESKVAEAAQRAADDLQRFSDRASESIARVSERFDEQPRLIDQAAQATRQLDDIIAQLGERQPPGFERMIAEAESAKLVVQDALVRPYRELTEEAQRRVQIESLVLQGREAEADALSEIWRLEERLGPLTEERKDEVLSLVQAERDVLEMLERQREVQGLYLDATRSVRQEVEAIFSGRGSLANFKNIFRDLQGQVLAESLFGGVFRDLDQWVKQNTGLGKATDQFTQSTEKAGSALDTFTADLLDAARKIRDPLAATGYSGADDTVGGAWGQFLGDFDAAFSKDVANDNGDITVVADILKKDSAANTAVKLTPEAYFRKMSDSLVGPLLGGLNSIFGTQAFSRLQGPLGGAFAGYAMGGPGIGGTIGAGLGLIKGIEGLPDAVSGALDAGLKGLGQGTLIAGLGKSLGIPISTTGAQLGGLAFGPLGAIAGGLIGAAFKSTPRGGATIGGSGSSLSVQSTFGNKSSLREAASGLGDSVIGTLDRIAEAFGAEIDAAAGAVTIGIRKGNYRVDTSGAGTTKTSRGAIDFGEDQAAAIEYATLDLIKDGVIKGLRQGTLRLLESAKDLETGLSKATAFEGVFNELKAIKDPVGAALDALDKEFTRLDTIFQEAGASTEEYASLTELYEMRRALAVKQASDSIIGSLRGLYDQLTVGDSGLSLRARLEAANDNYRPLADRVRAGDVTAYDDFADAAQTLLELQRELYGSQGPYFDLFNEIRDLTKSAIDAQDAVAQASGSRDGLTFGTPAANDNSSVVGAIGTMEGNIVNQLSTLNANIARMLELQIAGAGGVAVPDLGFASNF